VVRALAPEGPLVLAGHSMGGMTIMALAEQNPDLFTDRVTGVALVSTSAGEVGTGGLPAALLSRHNPLTRGVGLLARLQPTLVDVVRGVAGDLIWSITRSFAYGDRNVAPWLVDLVDTMISTNAVDALTDFVDTVGSHDRVAALPALATCELLVVAGETDRVIPFAHSERIAAELPGAEFVRIPGVGHLPMLEQPGPVDEALVRLVNRSVGPGRQGFLRGLGRRA
jgi:pimeloyl-ACP methyl ester carboxylesterase